MRGGRVCLLWEPLRQFPLICCRSERTCPPTALPTARRWDEQNPRPRPTKKKLLPSSSVDAIRHTTCIDHFMPSWKRNVRFHFSLNRFSRCLRRSIRDKTGTSADRCRFRQIIRAKKNYKRNIFWRIGFWSSFYSSELARDGRNNREGQQQKAAFVLFHLVAILNGQCWRDVARLLNEAEDERECLQKLKQKKKKKCVWIGRRVGGNAFPLKMLWIQGGRRGAFVRLLHSVSLDDDCRVFSIDCFKRLVIFGCQVSCRGRIIRRAGQLPYYTTHRFPFTFEGMLRRAALWHGWVDNSRKKKKKKKTAGEKQSSNGRGVLDNPVVGKCRTQVTV